MRRAITRLSVVFAAGAVGGLVNSLAVWGFGVLGVTHAFGVAIAPHWTPAWLYPRVVWGGIWGLLFLLPLLGRRTIARGLFFSLGPTVVQLFVVFPIKAHKGVAGLELGMLTPAFVVIFNAAWGLAAAVWLRLLGER